MADQPTLYITGASGFVGSALVQSFRRRGWYIYAQSRTAPERQSDDQLQWCQSPAEVQRPVDLLINLAGKSLATRWSQRAKQQIYQSRIDLTKDLAKSFANRPELAPGVVYSASAIGYYAQGDAPSNEQSPAGSGFAATLCSDWEKAAQRFVQLGSQVHSLRFGVVLHPSGGALHSMLPAFRLGLGARLGKGNQWFSWISRDDLVEALHFLYEQSDATPQAVNLVAPGVVTNREFTAKLAEALGRKAPFMAPAPLLRLALSEAADDFLLANLKVKPDELTRLQYLFRHPGLEQAFSDFFRP